MDPGGFRCISELGWTPAVLGRFCRFTRIYVSGWIPESYGLRAPWAVAGRQDRLFTWTGHYQALGTTGGGKIKVAICILPGGATLPTDLRRPQ